MAEQKNTTRGKRTTRRTTDEKIKEQIQKDIESKLDQVTKDQIGKAIDFDYSKTDADFTLINNLIKEQTEQYTYTVLEPRYHADGQSTAPILTDDDAQKAVFNISKDIVESLSPNYIYFLSMKYLNGAKQVYKYIIDKVYQHVISYIVTRNNQSNADYKAEQDRKKLALKTK